MKELTFRCTNCGGPDAIPCGWKDAWCRKCRGEEPQPATKTAPAILRGYVALDVEDLDRTFSTRGEITVYAKDHAPPSTYVVMVAGEHIQACMDAMANVEHLLAGVEKQKETIARLESDNA